MLSQSFIHEMKGALLKKKAELEKDLKGITTLSSRSDTDGMMHMQMCGTATGKVNVFEISDKDLAKAETLGFKRFKLPQ